MSKFKTSFWLGIFLCSVGSVCISSVGSAKSSEQAVGVNDVEVDGGGDGSVIDLYGESNKKKDDKLVEVGSYGEVSLHVKETDLTKVLQLLSIHSQRNIVASRNVSGLISADIYQVDFYDALDAILGSNGFGYREKGNFIYVYTQDELRAMEEMDRTVVTKIIRLNYLNTVDAKSFVAPLLSSAGTVTSASPVKNGFEADASDGGANSYAQSATLVLRDYEENIDQVLALLSELDARPAQVLIESWILQAALDEENQFGVDFAVFTDVNIGDFKQPLNAINDVISGSAESSVNSGQIMTTGVGQTARTGGAKLGVFGNDFSVFVRALDQVTDTTVLAKPQILVLNRQRAKLLVGEKLGYLSSTQTETSTTQSVEFLEVGTQLDVRPFVSTDGFVRLELKPSVSEGKTTVEADAIIPNTSTNEMTSNVMVKSGQTVVLGGFFRESNQVDRRQLPGAGDLPIVGAAFRGQDDTIKRNEVIFMIRPTVIKDKQLAAIGENALDGTRKAVLGSREGLLPFSQAKMSASYLRDARDQFVDGDVEKAIWSIDAALYVDPTSVEAMRLKEQLTGEQMYYESDSILDDAANAMIDAEISLNPSKKKLDANVEEEVVKKEVQVATIKDDHEVGLVVQEDSTATVLPKSSKKEVDELDEDKRNCLVKEKQNEIDSIGDALVQSVGDEVFEEADEQSFDIDENQDQEVVIISIEDKEDGNKAKLITKEEQEAAEVDALLKAIAVVKKVDEAKVSDETLSVSDVEDVVNKKSQTNDEVEVKVDVEAKDEIVKAEAQEMLKDQPVNIFDFVEESMNKTKDNSSEDVTTVETENVEISVK